MLAFNVAQAQWSELGGNNSLTANDDILAIETDDSGNIYVAGDFKNSSNQQYVSKFDGTSWTILGNPNYFSSRIQSMHFTNGKLYVAGGMNFVAVYDGNSWTQLGGDNSLQADDSINIVTSDNNGNIYAAGYFKNSNNVLYVAKFDGTSWSELGGTDSFNENGSSIHDIAFDSQNNAYVVGDFLNNGNAYVAKFDGTTWTSLPSLSGVADFGANSLQAIEIDANDNIYTAGYLVNGSFNNFVAKYDGTNWSELGGVNSLSESGYIYTLNIDNNNNIYIGGSFGNSSGNKYIANYNGNTWNELSGDNSLMANDIIQDMVITNDNKLAVVGNFTNTSGNQYVAITDNQILSINDFHKESKISFLIDYTTNTLQINPNNELITELSIYAINGQKLKSYGKEILNIDISTLSEGFYLLNIKTSNEIITRKFIKK
ncbi:T9SS type A sorting domain-containing protein [Pseudotamlana agarivorans]|uniref:T9SS type A sorting domain-containing protein n=1 Tax=Pseudotamlana agarivorans TaxID=481183 RepID=UPI0014725061|nr:T9SS type A sorting domain-containing protein [Tamlana agarivorans]